MKPSQTGLAYLTPFGNTHRPDRKRSILLDLSCEPQLSRHYCDEFIGFSSGVGMDWRCLSTPILAQPDISRVNLAPG